LKKKMVIKIDGEEYVTAGEAARILSERAGRPVSARVVTQYGTNGTLPSVKLDGRHRVYLRSAVEAYVIRTQSEQGQRAGIARRGKRKVKK
jgi:hypothetical protein